MKYKVIKKIKNIDELELGGIYLLESELYVYAGQSPMMGNAYTFMCEYGTYYLNKTGVLKLIETDGIDLVKATPEK